MKKTLSVIFALLLTVLLAFAAGCKPSAVPDSSGGGASDGWQGNWEKPDVPDTPDEPVKHTCENACYICGKCLTDCKDEACAEKCHEPRDRTKYVFNGTDKKVEKKGGVTIDGDHLGNINANPSAEVIYHVVAEKATVACLGATICEMFEDRYFTANTPLYVNGEQYYSRGYLKGGLTVWTDFYTVWLGCVNLKEGVNEIRFTGLADAYNFKDFTFLSDAKLSLSAAVEEHVCNHKNAAGKCTDYTCNADECLDKEESGWTVSEFGAGDERILKYGKKHGKEVSLWIAAENCIGNMANGSITGFSEQTVVTSFEVTEDTYVRISLSTSTSMSMGSPFTDMYTITFNGEEVKTGAKVEIVENGGWGRYVESRLIYLKAKKGLNSFVLVHNSSNMGDNINKIVFAVEKGELRLVAAAKPGETVAVESVALAVEGGVETLKKEETAKLIAIITPANATNRKLVFESSDKGVATVDDKGLVTAVGKGQATITVTTDDGKKTASVTIKVTEEQQIIPVTSIEISVGKTECLTDEEIAISAAITPLNATNAEVNWKVMLEKTDVTESVLTMKADGSATFKASDGGEYVITVTAKDGSGVFDEVIITVENKITGRDHFFEGENAEFAAGSTGKISVNTSDSNAKNNTSLGNINCNYGASLTFTVIAENDCRTGLYAALAFGTSHVDNIFTLKVNNKEVEIPSGFDQEGANWAKYDEFWLANINLVKGNNTICLTVTGGCGNFDYITIKGETSVTEKIEIKSAEASVKKELLKVGETVKCDVTVLPVSALSGLTVTYASDNTDVIEVSNDGTATAKKAGKATVNVTIGGLLRKINLFVVNGDGTAYEAENAVLTNASVESNGKYVGGINNAGAKVNFTVDGGAGGKVFLRIYTSVVDPGKTSVNDYFTIKVNDTDIDLTAGQFAYVGTGAGWNTDTGYFTVEITLGEGSNTIELISAGTSVQTTLDKIVIY